MARLGDVTKHAPVDRTAAMVAGRGVEYIPNKRVLTDEQDHPYPLKPVPKDCKDITGIRRGRLVCLGVSAVVNGRWSCRCDCGKYVLRTYRAITNENNSCDRCEHCRHLAYLKRKEEWIRLGRNVSEGWSE
jgi:hypothetical protein